MLNIDQISHPDTDRNYEYNFPTIDFKFQNTGAATAFLWQFVVDVIHAEIDPAPVLDFDIGIENNALRVKVTNYGWGTAHHCQINIDGVDEPELLNRLFADSVRQFSGPINSGETKTVFSFTKELANPDALEALVRELSDPNITFEHLATQDPWLVEKDLSSWDPRLLKLFIDEFFRGTDSKKRQDYVNRYHSWIKNDIKYFAERNPNLGKNLGKLNVSWSCEDDKGIKHKGSQHIWAKGYLTQKGFELVPLPPPIVNYSIAPSNITYISIVNPLRGPHELEYSFSRKIPLGDIERFHIMVGAPVSCHLLIQFKFFIDTRTVIESDVFDIHIQNTRKSRWHEKYTDCRMLMRNSEAPSRRYQTIPHRTIPEVSIIGPDYSMERWEKLSLFERYQAFVLYEADHYYNIGLEHLKQKRYEEALIACTQALHLSGDDIFRGYQNPARREVDRIDTLVYYHRGLALQNLERNEAALSSFHQAITSSHDTRDAQALYFRGKAFEALGNLAGARNAYEKARRRGYNEGG